MWPTDAQRLRFVCSETSRAPSRTRSKSRFDSPWPCVTMQKRCAPAASAALACSSICSGVSIPCLGVLRLGAESTVLCAPAGLRIDERAHVRRVAEAVAPRLECTVDELEDP